MNLFSSQTHNDEHKHDIYLYRNPSGSGKLSVSCHFRSFGTQVFGSQIANDFMNLLLRLGQAPMTFEVGRHICTYVYVCSNNQPYTEMKLIPHGT